MKASEHFKFPLEVSGDYLCQPSGIDRYAARFCTHEQAKVAANCISHADALADALESVIGLVNASNEDELQDFYLARGALAAYRGAK